MKFDKQDIKNAGLVVVGNLIYAIGVSTIITPLHLYSGGFTGIAQLIRLFLLEVVHLPQIGNIDYLGILYFIINIPAFIYAYGIMGRKFCIRTLVSIGMCSLFLSILPVPSQPIITDKILAAIVGGLGAGIGPGLVLLAGSSQGGQDILGICLAKTHPNFKVGTIGIIISACIYTVCLFVYDIETVLYSMIFAVVVGLSIDKVHTQNIKMQAIIVTKREEMIDAILKNVNRGATLLDGKGAYTREDTYVILTVLTKYEEHALKEQIEIVDPNAFVIITDNTRALGNFQKRFS